MNIFEWILFKYYKPTCRGHSLSPSDMYRSGEYVKCLYFKGEVVSIIKFRTKRTDDVYTLTGNPMLGGKILSPIATMYRDIIVSSIIEVEKNKYENTLRLCHLRPM